VWYYRWRQRSPGQRRQTHTFYLCPTLPEQQDLQQDSNTYDNTVQINKMNKMEAIFMQYQQWTDRQTLTLSSIPISCVALMNKCGCRIKSENNGRRQKMGWKIERDGKLYHGKDGTVPRADLTTHRQTDSRSFWISRGLRCSYSNFSW